MTLGRLKSVAALAVMLAGAPVLIPAAGAEEAHHPGTTATAQAQPQTPTPAPGQMPMQPGQMPMQPGQMPMQPSQMPMQPGPQGQGMMGRGMMGPGMMGGGLMHGTARIEGRLAFVKAELAITATQEKAWGDFANAVRTEAKAMDALRKEAADKPATTPLERLEQYERHLGARLDSTRKIRAALTPLYAALDDQQKKTLSELHPMLRGMM